MMHDGMPCGLIQGQGHVAVKVRNSSIFKIYLSLLCVCSVIFQLIIFFFGIYS